MTTENLLTALDAAPDSESRERLYAAASAPLTTADVYRALKARRPCGPWLAMRSLASPPGIPLPDRAEALGRILHEAGNAADAYTVLFVEHPDALAPDGPDHRLLHNAAIGAWQRDGGNVLTARLATASALASLAAGEPERAWPWLEFDRLGRPMPFLDPVRDLAALRDHPDLARDHWLRRAAWGLYAEVAFPAAPSLRWLPPEGPLARGEYVDRVGAVAGQAGRAAVSRGLARWDLAVVERLEATDAVRNIRRGALRLDDDPPAGAPPDGLSIWMAAALARREYSAARLAGRMILSASTREAPLFDFAVLAVLHDPRPCDAAFLAEHAPEPIRGSWREVLAALDRIPPEFREDLCSLATPIRRDFHVIAGQLRGSIPLLRPHVVEGGALAQHFDWIEDAERRIAESRPPIQPLVDTTASARRNLRGPVALTPERIQEAVRAAPRLPQAERFLPYLDGERFPDPLDRLLAGVVVLKSLKDGEFDEQRAVSIAEASWVAACAIWDVARPELLPLRAALLQDAAGGHPDPGIRVRAVLALANTICATPERAPDAEERAAVLIEGAAGDAWNLGDAVLLVDCLEAWARVISQNPAVTPRGQASARRASEALERARALDLPEFLAGRLDWAEASLLRAHPSASAGDARGLAQRMLTLLEAADRRLAPSDPARLDIGRERAYALVGLGRAAEAVEALERLVAALPPGEPLRERGYLLGTLGDVLVAAGEDLRAATVLRDALRDLGNDRVAAHVAAKLGDTLLRLGNVEAALDVVRRWDGREQGLPRADQIDLLHLRMALGLASGDREYASEAARTAATLASGTAWEAVTRLRASRLGLDGSPAEAASRYLGGAWERSVEADAELNRIAGEYPEQFAGDLRDAVAGRLQEHGDPWVLARLLIESGRVAEAIETIRHSLQDASDPGVRVNLRLLLVAVLPREDVGGLRETIDGIEADLHEGLALAGPQLNDLGVACMVASNGDPAWLRRAIPYLERALAASNGADWRPMTAQNLLMAIRGAINAAAPRSGADIAQLAQSAIAAVEVAGNAGARIVHEIVALLLLGGGAVHVECLEVAQQLLAEMGKLGNDPITPALARRMASIAAAQSGKAGRVEPIPKELSLRAPLGHAPPWIFSLVLGQVADAGPGDAVDALREIAEACRVRPDRADDILAWLLGFAPHWKPKAREKALSVVHLIAATGPQGNAAWVRTRPLVDGLPAECASEKLQILQAMDGFKAPAGLGRSVDGPAVARPKAGLPADEAMNAGLNAMSRARAASNRTERTRLRLEAIRHLERAVKSYRGTPMEREALISLGNARRLDPGPDYDGAILAYERANVLRSDDPDSNARLHKVWADALAQRGAPEDLRAAWVHIQESLAGRKDGGFRTTSLVSAANIATMHPDWDAARRAREVSRALGEALVLTPDELGEMLPRFLSALAEWSRSSGEAAEREALQERLIRAHPDRRAEIERAGRGTAMGPFGLPALSAREISEVGKLFADADWQAFAAAEMALQPAEVFVNAAAKAIAEGLGRHRTDPNDAQSKLREIREQHEKRSTTPALREAERRARSRSGSGAIGRFASRVPLLAELARRGAATLQEVVTATTEARDLLRHSGFSPMVRAHILTRMAHAWAPHNHVADVVRDFPLAVDLCREALTLVGGEAEAPRDFLIGLARALRYSPEESVQANLAEARRLYRRGLDQARASGNVDAIANDLDLLADLELELGEGGEVDRFRRVEALQREAVLMSDGSHSRSRYRANLAWTLTRLGSRLPTAEAISALTEAEALYEAALGEIRDPWGRENTLSNLAVCRDTLAAVRGDPGAAVGIWEQRVRQGRGTAPPVELAKAEHNLAEALVRRGTVGDLRRAVELYRGALPHRPREQQPRFHWETALGLGLAVVRLAAAGENLSRSIYDEALAALRSAIRAARLLGEGAELQRAAVGLLRFAHCCGPEAAVATLAGEGWAALRGAMPALLMHPESNQEESVLAVTIAFDLARIAEEGGVVGTLVDGTALSSGDSREVIRWLIRSDVPYRRLLEAMLRPPVGLPQSDAARLRAALAARSQADVSGAIREIRNSFPDWLLIDPSLDDTLVWLRRVPGSVAIAVWPGSGGILVALIDGDSGTSNVLLLRCPVPPLEEARVHEALRDGGQRAPMLAGLTGWARRHVAEPVRRFLGAGPKRILWVPHGALRSIPPRRLFPGIPVAVSASLALRPGAAVRARAHAPVVIAADPGSGTGALGAEALRGAGILRDALGGARLVVGRGREYGPTVAPGAADTGPTVRQVLRELDHADFAAIIAHGRVGFADDAYVDLLSPTGESERLDARRLAEDPGAITGLTVLLLSCETGRVGDEPGRPGAIAGTLLVAGAEQVIAPLWPVSLRSALDVGERVCRAYREGSEIASVLAVDPVSGGPTSDEPSPALGRPTAAQREASEWDLDAFVTWVG